MQSRMELHFIKFKEVSVTLTTSLAFGTKVYSAPSDPAVELNDCDSAIQKIVKAMKSVTAEINGETNSRFCLDYEEIHMFIQNPKESYQTTPFAILDSFAVSILNILKDKNELYSHAAQLNLLNKHLQLTGKNNTDEVLSKYIVLAFLVVDLDDMDYDPFHKSLASYRHVYLQAKALFRLGQHIFVRFENSKIFTEQLHEEESLSEFWYPFVCIL